MTTKEVKPRIFEIRGYIWQREHIGQANEVLVICSSPPMLRGVDRDKVSWFSLVLPRHTDNLRKTATDKGVSLSDLVSKLNADAEREEQREFHRTIATSDISEVEWERIKAAFSVLS